MTSCFLNAVFLFCLCWCRVSLLTRSFPGGGTSVSKGSVPCLITSNQVGFRFPSFRLKRRRLCPKDFLPWAAGFCSVQNRRSALRAWRRGRLVPGEPWPRSGPGCGPGDSHRPSLPARHWACGLLLWPSAIPSVRTAPAGCGQTGAGSVGSRPAQSPPPAPPRSSLHVRKVERTPGRRPPLTASRALRPQLVRRSLRHIRSPPRDRWCGVRHARLRGDGSGRELAPVLVTVEPEGQGEGRAGLSLWLPTRPCTWGLRSAVCWPSRPVTRPGPGNSGQRLPWLPAPRRAWPGPGASWPLPFVRVRATRGGEHSPASRESSFRLHVRCSAPHPPHERGSICGGPCP